MCSAGEVSPHLDDAPPSLCPGVVTVAKPQYRHAHQAERARWAPVIAAGDGWCAELRCLKRTRWIPPGSSWHLAHDRANGGYLGPAHAGCNSSEGAAHGNRLRGRRRKPTAPPPPPTGRWQL